MSIYNTLDKVWYIHTMDYNIINENEGTQLQRTRWTNPRKFKQKQSNTKK